jgi:sigma-B regulation protein RsbU (phosphoserine phosphatase)
MNALDLAVSYGYPVFVRPGRIGAAGGCIDSGCAIPRFSASSSARRPLERRNDDRSGGALGVILSGDVVGVGGVKLTRAITGAVHELYEGTQHVREGDFDYRIPVKGTDQIAELASSFNTMTSNLGSLIVVAKEKERLESELAIARDVQNQLFPKDVPFTKSLELKGVCSPARMVSGDYYDYGAAQ